MNQSRVSIFSIILEKQDKRRPWRKSRMPDFRFRFQFGIQFGGFGLGIRALDHYHHRTGQGQR